MHIKLVVHVYVRRIRIYSSKLQYLKLIQNVNEVRKT